MDNIFLDSQGLSSLITKLEEDNQKINENIINLNKNIKGIDKNYWDSKEKSKLDDKMIPFMTNTENSILVSLNRCTDMLKSAISNYEKTEKNLKNKGEEVLADTATIGSGSISQVVNPLNSNNPVSNSWSTNNTSNINERKEFYKDYDIEEL